jgi:hypothetical protein
MPDFFDSPELKSSNGNLLKQLEDRNKFFSVEEAMNIYRDRNLGFKSIKLAFKALSHADEQYKTMNSILEYLEQHALGNLKYFSDDGTNPDHGKSFFGEVNLNNTCESLTYFTKNPELADPLPLQLFSKKAIQKELESVDIPPEIAEDAKKMLGFDKALGKQAFTQNVPKSIFSTSKFDDYDQKDKWREKLKEKNKFFSPAKAKFISRNPDFQNFKNCLRQEANAFKTVTNLPKKLKIPSRVMGYREECANIYNKAATVLEYVEQHGMERLLYFKDHEKIFCREESFDIDRYSKNASGILTYKRNDRRFAEEIPLNQFTKVAIEQQLSLLEKLEPDIARDLKTMFGFKNKAQER